MEQTKLMPLGQKIYSVRETGKQKEGCKVREKEASMRVEMNSI